MTYTLNDYCKLVFSNPNAPRVVVYPNNAIAASLLNHHKSNGAAVVSIADCIPTSLTSLPMPSAIFLRLDEKIQNQSGRVTVIGIDAYLALLSKDNVMAFFVALRGRIDSGRLNAIYLISDSHDLCFDSPRYEESLDVVKVSGDFEYIEPPKVAIVSDEWVSSGNLIDYHTLLKQFGDFLPTGNYTLVLKNIHSEQAGLGNNVSFVLDIRQVAECFYSVSSELESSTIKRLLSKAKEKRAPPESYLKTEFGAANIDVKLALKRLLDLADDDIWAAYVWLLQKHLPADTYLIKVLSSGVSYNNLLRKYVVDSAISVMNDNAAKKFAAERARALTGLAVEPLLIEFIGQTKDDDGASEFLNCGTEAERTEIVRRVSKLDLLSGLPEPFKHIYPPLADYLSSEFDYGNNDLNTYFREYRRLKIANTITESFAQKAFEAFLPTSCPTRDSVLLDLRNENTALLVVDGMGAEYYPLLLGLAKRFNIHVDSFTVASAKLPTATSFNPITWNSEQTLNVVKGLDNIIHNGAAKYEHCTPERNIVAVLRVFEIEVFNRIADGLSHFLRVVVTADHGASRLAVLAHNKGLGATLPWNSQPLDWRYSLARENETRPQEFEQQYHPENGATYWAVRGYNRLPKSGGKMNELHGGASLEERLVPVVVFSRGKNDTQHKQAGKKTTEQIVDKMDFDILGV